MASATWNVAFTTIVPMVFGTRWRSMIRQDRPPIVAHCLDIFPGPQAQRLAADQPGRAEPGQQRQHDDEQHNVGLNSEARSMNR